MLKNGSLFFNFSTEPSFYFFDFESFDAPLLVQHFPHKTSFLGIAQLNHSTMAVIARNLSGSLYENDRGMPNSFSVFLLALSKQVVASIPIPGASLLKGMTSLPDAPTYLSTLVRPHPRNHMATRHPHRQGQRYMCTGLHFPLIPTFFVKSPKDDGP